jgi:hypothetical protein
VKLREGGVKRRAGAVALVTLVSLLAPPMIAEAHTSPPPIDVTLIVRRADVSASVLIDKYLLATWVGTGERIDLDTPISGPDGLRSIARRLEVSLDGAVVAPGLRRLFEPTANDPRASLPEVRLILDYPCSARPTSIRVRWLDFDGVRWERQAHVPLVIVAGAQIDSTTLSPSEASFDWHVRPLEPWRSATAPVPDARRKVSVPLPLVALGLLALVIPFLPPLRRRSKRSRMLVSGSLVLATAATAALGLLDATPVWARPLPPCRLQAETVFRALVGHVYRGCDAESEDELYELLVGSVDRPLLDRLYLDDYRSLVAQESEGARCHVEDVEFNSITIRFPDDGSTTRFDVDASWRVTGTIAHWGHTHRRIDGYSARASVRHNGHAWRLAAIDVTDHSRLDDGRQIVASAPDTDRPPQRAQPPEPKAPR